MIRIAALDSAISVDAAARLGGRGGYLHQRAECLERFERSRVKEFRSLRRRISLEERREITRAVRERLVSKTSLD